jgi:glycosyltransferase involved in cell wall biosynthesis
MERSALNPDADSNNISLISVVIPCFNQAKYLGEAIESALSQTYRNFEIVVVDDGSQDNTAEVTASYSGVKYIRQENRGLAAARNTGLHHSKGTYLVFLDADDRLLPAAIENGLTCLIAHRECAFVSGHYRYIKADGSIHNEFPQRRIKDNHYLELLRGNYIGMHATVMHRREALVNFGGFDTSLPACEDYDLYLRVARKFPIACHEKMVAEYRLHDLNMSRNAELMIKTVLSVLQGQKKYARQDRQYKKAYKSGIKFWKNHYGEKLFHQVAHSLAHRKTYQVFRPLRVLIRYAPLYFARQTFISIKSVIEGILKPILPVSILRLLAKWHGRDFCPPVGHVKFGDLRRVTPISREFGYDRGLPIDRYYIENFLACRAGDIRGHVLEIGDDCYTRKFGSKNVTASDVLHVEEGNPPATIVADLTCADHIPSDRFDCIICTQTLHLIYDVKSASGTLYRILKPGGILLLTVPGASQISMDEWANSWHWAFTVHSSRRLFEEHFPTENLEVETFGNVLAATAFLQGLAVEELRQEELDCRDPQFQFLITIRAVKH